VSRPGRVLIHYRRLPDQERVFDQQVVLERADVIVTLSQPLELARPMLSDDGELMLEDGSLALWFTFPGAWHDIGLFHRADGTFTGLYANILTPPRIDGTVWHTTDLFLDLWRPEGGATRLLDEHELEDALAQGHIDRETAARARREAERLLSLAGTGAWPPPVVGEWTLERALEVVARRDS
jgi:predicted RNA-binding protein associated with RNAse of E/G family